MLLKPEQEDHKKFFNDHGVPFCENANVQAAFDPNIRKFWNVSNIPVIMFSHPHGLAKRLSIGTLPNDIKDYPVIQIQHTLGTCPGSSGGNLLFSPLYDRKFTTWISAFLHWGHIPDSHGLAIGWQAIGDCMRALLASAKSQPGKY